MDLETLALKIQQLEDTCSSQNTKIKSLECKLDKVLEQVTLGKHMVQFAKLMGWVIGVLAAMIEVYRQLKGN